MDRENTDFSKIEPYRDGDVKEVLSNLVKDEAFLEVMEYVFPEKKLPEIEKVLGNIETVDQFQAEIAYTAMKNIIHSTAKSIDIQGLENIEKGSKHLFVSNHRDIILDSAFFNVLLHENNIETTETAIGSNLLGHPTVNALTKLNKNFTVGRNLSGRELYESSLILSQYIRESIVHNRSSIWISQREGRAKDGDDKTQKGLLKMIGLSAYRDQEKDFADLNIRTLSISYEYDPCDVFKVKELLAREKNEEYFKEDGEDKMSIVAGITGNKGRIHFQIGPGNLNLDFCNENELGNADRLQCIANAIDAEIYENYKLWPNNYIAYDLLNNSNNYIEKYTEAEAEEFNAYTEKVLSQIDDHQKARALLLKKYSFPVENFLAIKDLKRAGNQVF